MNLVDALLLAFAFTAGAAAFFAPCCIALLPAYVNYAIRPYDNPASGAGSPHVLPRGWRGPLLVLSAAPLLLGVFGLLARGLAGLELLPPVMYVWLPPLDPSLGLLLVGTTLASTAFLTTGGSRELLRGALFGTLAVLGVFTTFLAVGLPVALLADQIGPYLPLTSVVIGIVLAIAGLFLLLGRTFSLSMPVAAAAPSSLRGYFIFGGAYGAAGLGCTFPLFAAVMATAAASGSFVDTLAVFGAYAFGKAAVLMTFTAIIVAGATQVAQRMRAWAHPIQRASGALMILSGGYLAYYYGHYLVDLGGFPWQ